MSPLLQGFLVFIVSIAVALLLTYYVPPVLALTIVPLALGTWLTTYGFLRRGREVHGGVLSTATTCVVWGLLIITVTLAYLLHILGTEVRILVAVLLLGLMTTVLSGYYVERSTRRRRRVL